MTFPRYDDLPTAPGGGRSAWGLSDAHDLLGRLSLLGAEEVRQAVGLVGAGSVFALSAAADEFDPPLDDTRSVTRHRVLRGGGAAGVEDLDDVLDDYFPQISSQWDSLAHIAASPGVFYNSATVEDILERGVNTIDHWARRGIVGRGVLLDVRRALVGTVDTSHGSLALSVDDLERARQLQGVEFSPGCLVLVRTGFLEWYRGQDPGSRAALSQDLHAPGIEHSEAMARYLWDNGLSAIVSDSFATEVWPPDWTDEARPFGFLHRVLIGRLGLAIGELWDLEALAANCQGDGVFEFLLVSAPLHVRGGIGSPANAIAIK